MIEVLDQHYERLRLRVAAMRELCRAPAPDMARLSRARHQLMAASMDRSRFLKQTAYPALLSTGIVGIAAALDTLDQDLSKLRAAASLHVSSWPPDRIGADWRGYCAASAALMRRIEDRGRRERTVLMPALAALTHQIDA
ncbi:hypothetical protein [uncultured Sphingomonas sp.]|uniref:hypothetical protein n=1 Tax=uncultured Sphingomonas sp. TaxID=158754 RepID=UPI0025D49D39|nr:hypothetical protein [uncultured Sphingomonas sp.]